MYALDNTSDSEADYLDTLLKSRLVKNLTYIHMHVHGYSSYVYTDIVL